MRVRKGDQVEIVAGKDKGRQGKVLSASPRERRVTVEGVNRITKHTKIQQTQRGAREGGLVHQEAPIDVSNVMVVGSEDQPTRVGYRKDDNGRPVRFSRRTGKDI